MCFRQSVPWRRSISSVCSKVTFFSGKVGFTTGLTRWVERSWFSVSSVFSVFCIGIVGYLIDGVRFCLTNGYCRCCYCQRYSYEFWPGLSLISIDCTGFGCDLSLCSGDEFIWVFLDIVAWFVASQFLSAAHLELPNHSIPTPSQVLRHSDLTSYSPSATD